MQLQKWNYKQTVWAIVALAVLSEAVVAVYVYWWWRPATVILVRHAEKSAQPAADPVLTAAGEARAQKLVHVAGVSGINAVFTSSTQRARQTAQPLSTSLGITPVELPAADLDRLVDSIRTHHRNGRVFVVGHSNTVPQIIAKLGGSVPAIPETEFDNMYIVTPGPFWYTRVVRLKYGEATP